MSDIIVNSKVAPPCKDCPNRKLGCHSIRCEPWRAYEKEKMLEEVERVKKNEGIFGSVTRLSAIIG